MSSSGPSRINKESMDELKRNSRTVNHSTLFASKILQVDSLITFKTGFKRRLLRCTGAMLGIRHTCLSDWRSSHFDYFAQQPVHTRYGQVQIVYKGQKSR